MADYGKANFARRLNPIGRASSSAANGGTAGAALSAGYRGIADDPFDGAGTAPTLDAAAKASTDLVRIQRLLARYRHHVSYLVVTQYIA